MPHSQVRERLLSILHRARLLVPARDAYNWLRYRLNLKIILSNAAYRRRGAQDGLPIPTPKLMHLVSGNYNLEGLFVNGRMGAECIRNILEKHRVKIDELTSILDFGCGCGRVFRFWKDVRGPALHGCDYNPELVAWCASNLPFGKFGINRLAPPLPYPDGAFDFIYAISVFTHLPEPLQRTWLNELLRVSKPGGHLYITVLGTRNTDKLSPAERAEFDAGRLIVEKAAYSGTNICRVFHPEQYLRETFARGTTVVDFIPGGARDAEGQDVVLLKK